jgi:diguanylate cyclase
VATDGKLDFVFRNDFPFPRLSADCQRSTMHFIGMLAAPIPADAVYLVLPTVVSFPICALAVGISLFFVSTDNPSLRRVVASVILLGAAIARMH